jgi:2-dehydropantoate 2-reductase
MARIAIVGPGAIGGALAAWLCHTGRHEVTLCARRPLDGALRVETPNGPLTARPRVLTDPSQTTSVDWVFVTTKAYDAAGAATWLPGLGGNQTPVAIIQNGVEHRSRFEPFLSADRIVPVMIDLPAERVTPTHIRQRGAGKMVVTDDAHGRAFAELFTGTPLNVSLTSDLKSAVWRKLCINAAGVISGLTMQPAGVMRDEKIGELARMIVREVIAVGRAEGAVLDDSLADSVLQGYRNNPVDSVNSLHGDRIAGRVTEIDARNGVVVRLGRKHGIATPCNQMAVALIEAMTKPSA